MKFRCSKCGYTGDGPDFPHAKPIDGRDCQYVAAIDRLTPTPSPEAEALPTLPVVAWQDRDWVQTERPVDACSEFYRWQPLTPHAPAEAAIVALRAEVAELRKERDDLQAKLRDPVLVHVALLRGEIARPTVGAIRHIYGASLLGDGGTL